jgi:hypothetical protein
VYIVAFSDHCAVMSSQRVRLIFAKFNSFEARRAARNKSQNENRSARVSEICVGGKVEVIHIFCQNTF